MLSSDKCIRTLGIVPSPTEEKAALKLAPAEIQISEGLTGVCWYQNLQKKMKEVIVMDPLPWND